MKIKTLCFFLSLLMLFCACGEVPTAESEYPPAETETETDAKAETDATEVPTETQPVDYGDDYMEEITEIRTNVTERTTRPTEFERSSSYDDMIFYEASETVDASALPPSTTVFTWEDVLKHVQDKTHENGVQEIFHVSDGSLPFDTAVRARVTTVPQTPYSFQLTCGKNTLSGKVKNGHTVLISLYARVTEGNGRMGIVLEETGDNGTHNKLISTELPLTSEWQEFLLPVKYSDKYPALRFRYGYAIQTIEFGGFTIRDFGTDVLPSALPGLGTVKNVDLAEDAPWREQALARIEEIRKGDIKIVVTDKSGMPLTDAKTEIEMYEHQFEWGVAVNSHFLQNDITRQNVARYFNAAVLENEFKWTKYEAAPQTALDIVKRLSELGIDTVRGHCLVWDRERRENDTSVPLDLTEVYHDREAMTERIRSHIEQMMTDTNGMLTDWDVLNEACANTVMQDIHGRELIKEWFSMARQYGDGVTLYYNDYVTTQQLFDLLDTFEEMGVDYDGIGIQSHYSSAKSMEDISKFYQKLAAYGKELKVTEYDFATNDEILQAAFTRDLMILSFSIEQMEGFYLWGLRGGENDRYVCFDSNWNPRPALEQIEDLIYNKWMTREGGRTDENGELSFRGFYGSYKISVTAGGVKKTVLVDCHKGENNTIHIQMP